MTVVYLQTNNITVNLQMVRNGVKINYRIREGWDTSKHN